MQDFFILTLAFLAAYVGGIVGIKLKIPVGGMVGAMVGAVIFNVTVPMYATLPNWFSLVFQVPLGIMIGNKVTKEDLLSLAKLYKSYLVVLFTFLTLNIVFGLFLQYATMLDLTTALFATSPGGMTDMVIISDDFGAVLPYVAVIQLFRNVSVMTFVSPIYRKIIKKNEQVTTNQNEHSTVGTQQGSNALREHTYANRFAMTLLCSLPLALGFRWLDIPAGTIIGAMLGAMAYNIYSKRAYFPKKLGVPMRICAGFFVGMRIDRYNLETMAQLVTPLAYTLVYVFIVTFTTAFFVHKITKLDMATSLLVSTPGGLSEMALIADEMNLDTPKVAVLHTARLISVIALFPTVFMLILR